MNYEKFLQSKIELAPESGFEITEKDLPSKFLDGTKLKPHQRDAIIWAVKGGRRALFESFGLGKTIQQLIIIDTILKKYGGKALIVCPLGVKQEFTTDATNKLGLELQYITCLDDAKISNKNIFITNYERVRDGDIDPKYFTVTSLDEASVLRSFGSKTYQLFLDKFKGVKYKFVCTATPSPNKFKELIHYAGYLEIMDTGQALTRFFKRDSTKANNLTIYPHKEEEFWLWVSTWALFLTKPSDLGYEDEGYDLPKLNVIYHRVGVDHSTAGIEQNGQVKMFRDAALGLKDASKEKRDSAKDRVNKMMEIISDNPDDHFILWHDLEYERHVIKKILPESVEVFGSLEIDKREQRTIDFSNGKIKYLATKPRVSGSGCNFQRHCNNAIFVGIGYKFNDWIQSVHRIYRFLQDKDVNIHIIYTESEDSIKEVLLEKWKRHEYLIKKMTEIIYKYGLSLTKIEDKLKRTIGIMRQEVTGKYYRAINNDSVLECASMKENSIDLIHTSIPFGNHYEYSPSYNDFGHNAGNKEFFEQMEFLTKELLRVLKPGRVAAIHTKDRILFGNATGTGMPTLDPFSDLTVSHYIKNGFQYFGRITIVTDVVRENNQTYRLGWSEQCKDGTKMGVGCPEYILLFRKLPTDTGKAYADDPVVKHKHETYYECPECQKQYQDLSKLKTKLIELAPDVETGEIDYETIYICSECENELSIKYFNIWQNNPLNVYTRAQWQIDAHAFWRSSGNRMLNSEELKTIPVDKLQGIYREFSRKNIYNYKEHVDLAKHLDKNGKLPASFQVTAVGSHDQDRVWDNVNRMNTMNSKQSQKNLQMHICPLQFDIVERIINRFSNEGETVLDPFGGLMTVPYQAVKMNRIGIGIELNPEYYADGLKYMRAIEEKKDISELFDLLEVENVG